ncbi:MAG: hypothetical protein KIT84_29930 [Labilithrix sp.]|nr:hypothetical protein [Labilithrix sp.]MCW5815283.1 hypothetical protein [Labilithrix sp.]
MRLTLPSAAALVATALVVLSFASVADAAGCRDAADSAQDLKKQGKLHEARAQLLVCAQKSCKEVIRTDCEKWLREVDEETPTIIVRVVDASGKDVLGAHVTVDDAPVALDGNPVEVDPGPRTIKARSKSGEAAEEKVLVALGEKKRVVEVRLADERPAETKETKEPKIDDSTEAPGDSNVVPLTLGVVGGVALVSFVVFQVLGRSGYSDLENGCAKTAAGCTDADIDPVKTQFIASGVSLGISVLALGAAAIVYFARKPAATALRPLRFEF